MIDQTADQLSLLTEIRQKLEEMERNSWARNIEKLDIGKIAMDLRKARRELFPDGYFMGGNWDILLALDHAGRTGRKMQLADIARESQISENLVQRYVDVLMTDGFVYQEDDASDHHKAYIILTSKGMAQMKQLFVEIQTKFARMAGLFDTAQPNVLKDDAGNSSTGRAG